jgi:hypothetical protein
MVKLLTLPPGELESVNGTGGANCTSRDDIKLGEKIAETERSMAGGWDWLLAAASLTEQRGVEIAKN